MANDRRVSIVLLTHNRVHELERALRHLLRLPEQPALIMVDNASNDGSTWHVARHFPQVQLVRCHCNLGAAGRNLGVLRARTPYVAFCDDDTWWAAGSLARAADLLDAHPSLAAVGARVLVGPQESLDPTCERMAESPLDAEGLPGHRLIAFMAGAVVMRTQAYLEVDGYEPHLFLGAEEALMGLDLAARDWRMIYSEDVVSHHHPSPARNARSRQILLTRNRVWIAWMRLPLQDARHETARLWREAEAEGLLAPCLRQSLRGMPWAWRHRRVLPPNVQAMWRQVCNAPDRAGLRSPSRLRPAPSRAVRERES